MEAGMNSFSVNLNGYALLQQSVIVEVITMDTIERRVVMIQ